MSSSTGHVRGPVAFLEGALSDSAVASPSLIVFVGSGGAVRFFAWKASFRARGRRSFAS